VRQKKEITMHKPTLLSMPLFLVVVLAIASTQLQAQFPQVTTLAAVGGTLGWDCNKTGGLGSPHVTCDTGLIAFEPNNQVHGLADALADLGHLQARAYILTDMRNTGAYGYAPYAIAEASFGDDFAMYGIDYSPIQHGMLKYTFFFFGSGGQTCTGSVPDGAAIPNDIDLSCNSTAFFSQFFASWPGGGGTPAGSEEFNIPLGGLIQDVYIPFSTGNLLGVKFTFKISNQQFSYGTYCTSVCYETRIESNMDWSDSVRLTKIDVLDDNGTPIPGAYVVAASGTNYNATSFAFPSFSNKLETRTFVTSTGTVKTSFDLVSNFTLNSTSDGINPPTETTVLDIGSYQITIPTGSFHKNSKGYFVYEGTINGESLELQIVPGKANTYTLKAEGTGTNSISLAVPVHIGLEIGNDVGAGTATLDN
jgi:hypothetical protein